MDKFTIIQDDGYVGLYENGLLIREHSDIGPLLDEITNLEVIYTNIGALGLETFPPRLEEIKKGVRACQY